MSPNNCVVSEPWSVVNCRGIPAKMHQNPVYKLAHSSQSFMHALVVHTHLQTSPLSIGNSMQQLRPYGCSAQSSHSMLFVMRRLSWTL